MGLIHTKKMKTFYCPHCKTNIQFKHTREFDSHKLTCHSSHFLSTLNTNPSRQTATINNFLPLLESNNFFNDSPKEGNDGIIPKSNGTFDQKVKYFRQELQKVKLDWRNGSETITVVRDNIVHDSITQFKQIDPLKELKISFQGEISLDAGGIIREWLTVLFCILLDEKENLFEKADTDDVSYITKKHTSFNDDIMDKYYFIGQILSKALLENLTVNCCFNSLIYKMILNETITIDDLVFIDKPLYHSLMEMQKMGDKVNTLNIYFSTQYTDPHTGMVVTKELIDNGNNTLVTKANLTQYVNKTIDFIISVHANAVEQIKRGMFSIIDKELLQIFTSNELDLIINGTPFIDIEDWRMNSRYKNYTSTDEVIINFWSIMDTLSQEELSKFLQFCTGSSRVPIGGFAALESNRGYKCKFCITKVEYINNERNFLKAHTCFNRLDLPTFPNKNALKEAITFILNNETFGFGIE